jgi:hypothetical protein
MSLEKGCARMNEQPRIRELQSLVKAKSKYVHPTDEHWQRIFTAVTNPDLHAVVALCLIGLLLTLNLIFRFPDMGAVIAQYNQF